LAVRGPKTCFGVKTEHGQTISFNCTRQGLKTSEKKHQTSELETMKDN